MSRVSARVAGCILLLLVAYATASRSLFFGGQFIMSNTSSATGKFSSFAELKLNNDGTVGTFQPTGTGIFDSSSVVEIAIYPESTTAFILGDFLWANRQYSSLVVSMDVKNFNLSPMGRGIAATTYKKQIVVALQNGDAVVGGLFANIETVPHITFPNLAMFQQSTGNWVKLDDPTNVWNGREVYGLAAYQNKLFVYGADQRLYSWVQGVGFTVITETITLDVNSLSTDQSGYLYATHQQLIDGEQGAVVQDTVYMWEKDYVGNPQEIIVRESTVACSPVLIRPYLTRVVAAIPTNDTCETWRFAIIAGNGTIIRDAFPELRNGVNKMTTSVSGNLVVSGPQDEAHIVESIFTLSGGANTWQEVNLGFNNFVVKSMAYCDAKNAVLIDVVNVESLNRTMLMYSPNAKTVQVAVPDSALVKPGIVSGIAQLSSGEIGVAGKFSFAGEERYSNAAVLRGNDWSDLSFKFAPQPDLPDSAVGLVAVGNTFYTAGGGVKLLQNAPLPFYYRTLSSKWELIPGAPTSSRVSSSPSVSVVYAYKDTVYFGGLLNAQIGQTPAVGVVAYNTKTKVWSSLPISAEAAIFSIRTISQWGDYLAFGGMFEFTVGESKYINTAVYNLSNNTFMAPGASLAAINQVYSFGWHEPTKKAFVLGNLVNPTPPLEPTGALMYNYPEDTFTNAPILPVVNTAAYNEQQLWVGGSFSGPNYAALARWTGTTWTSVNPEPTEWFFEGSVTSMFLTSEPQKGSSGLAGWAIALITIASIIGAVLLVAIIVAGVYFVHKRNNNYETL